MKKLNVIPLIALLCLLFSCIIGIFDLFIEIPLALRVFNILLVLAASILFLIFVKKQDKNNKK
jgi:hypothetical protein